MREEGIVPIVDTATRLLSKKPCRIYWMTANPTTLGTAGTLTLYDGFSTSYKKCFEMITGYDRFNQFVPPLACTNGLYVVISGIASYTIGFEEEDLAKKIK